MKFHDFFFGFFYLNYVKLFKLQASLISETQPCILERGKSLIHPNRNKSN